MAISSMSQELKEALMRDLKNRLNTEVTTMPARLKNRKGCAQ